VLAAVLIGRRQWTVTDVPVPAVGSGEILVRTEVAAVCGSDLHAAAGATSAYPPGAPGHEAVGTVVESRSPRFAPGDRVLCVPAAAEARCFAQCQVLPGASAVRLPAAGRAEELVIEAAGRDETRHQAMRMVRVDGRIGLFGVEEKPGLSTYPFAEVFRRRPTIEMTWGAQFEPGLASFVAAADDVASGVAGLSGLITHRVPLTQIDMAFALATDPRNGALKVAVTFDA
jgi:threonine dehydrogenase-like Zn-dependent dehydrogenase